MSSTPLICCSSGVATVWAMVSGLAPGYCAMTMTVGGTRSGYCDTGNTRRAISPIMTKKMDRTAEKTGRRRKKPSLMTALVGVVAVSMGPPP